MPVDSAALFTTMLQDEATEVFAILCLSTKHRVLAYHEVSRGCLDSTLVHPREVFKAALLANAATIVLCHYVARNIMAVMCLGLLCGRTAHAVMFLRSEFPLHVT